MKWLISPLGGKEMMFHVVVIAVCGSFLSSLAFGAETNNVMGVTQNHYKTVINQRPFTVEVCKEVAVSGDKTGDTLRGAIIGGIIGHQIDHDKGAKAGAVIGGLIGHDKSDAVGGTRTQCHTETRYQEETTTVYSHSTVTFWDGGQEFTLRFQR